jgi:hypothetical protein
MTETLDKITGITYTPKQTHSKVINAILHGKLIRPNTCEVCGKTIDKKKKETVIDIWTGNPRDIPYYNPPIVAHHADYSKPLDIIWVCRQCHYKIHKGIIEVKNNGTR